MKKQFLLFMAFVILISFCTCINVAGQEMVQTGLPLSLNGTLSGDTSILYNQMHYLPLRAVFEKMGASVFYRSRDKQILALTPEGETIRHNIGSNTISKNDTTFSSEFHSMLYGDVAYIPVDMVYTAFSPDELFCNEQQLNIQKQIPDNQQTRLIGDVLAVSKACNFYPERFPRYLNYHTKMPSYGMQEVLFRVNLGLDYPFYDNVVTIEHPYELLVLVNKYHQLPPDFTQYNLVNMAKEHTINDGKQYLLFSTAYEKYIQMYEAAKKDGLSIKVLSAYRTENYQRGLYNNKLNSSGKVYADNYSARPGFSEHQTGLAVDINTTRTSFEHTSEFRWLQQHAHEFGYIMRYPKGKEWITGYAYEPWHYRFVGTDAASIIHKEGITYEEYYAMYISVKDFN